ncbi:Orotate phosphoribosyltransferase [uncultured archaeon]|nr:Orotate phosphoribosyltransferase [uncultured archaeon]
MDRVSKAQIPECQRRQLIACLRPLEGIVIRESTKGASGGTLPDYVDVKRAYGFPAERRLIADALQAALEGENVGWLVAAGHGGISPASILADRAGMRLTLVRSEPKGHGRPGLLDGYEQDDPDGLNRVAYVDDVLTSGGSINEMNRTLLREMKALGRPMPDIACAIVVVKRGNDADIRLDCNIPCAKYILTRDELL